VAFANVANRVAGANVTGFVANAVRAVIADSASSVHECPAQHYQFGNPYQFNYHRQCIVVWFKYQFRVSK
jgi:hypothetical protein